MKLKCDPKTVQSILRHEDPGITMGLYVQSDQETKLEAQGKFLELLLEGRSSPADRAGAVNRDLNRGREKCGGTV